jgi:hypothetical protein
MRVRVEVRRLARARSHPRDGARAMPTHAAAADAGNAVAAAEELCRGSRLPAMVSILEIAPPNLRQCLFVPLGPCDPRLHLFLPARVQDIKLQLELSCDEFYVFSVFSRISGKQYEIVVFRDANCEDQVPVCGVDSRKLRENRRCLKCLEEILCISRPVWIHLPRSLRCWPLLQADERKCSLDQPLLGAP